MSEIVYAGTGHRPEALGGYRLFPRLVNYARESIVACGATKMISGMALGWDLAIAQACVDLGMPFTAAVPFAGQDQIWPAEPRHLYHELLGEASEVVIVSEGGFASWKFIRRDEWMVDHADALLALWNGQRHGGTYQCLKYAGKVKRPVHNVWRGWKEYCDKYAA